jgi:hypothetical protein
MRGGKHYPTLILSNKNQLLFIVDRARAGR